MTKQEIIEARRALLAAEIKTQGLAALARNTKKPDRQLNDMARGRKSFGDGISKEIGPLIRPDLPREWLVYPDKKYLGSEVNEPQTNTYKANVSAAVRTLQPRSQRDKDLAELMRLASEIDATGLGMLIRDAQKLAKERPFSVKKTAKSSN